MGPAPWLTQNLGLVALSALGIAMTAYLIYVMIHPERF